MHHVPPSVPTHPTTDVAGIRTESGHPLEAARRTGRAWRTMDDPGSKWDKSPQSNLTVGQKINDGLCFRNEQIGQVGGDLLAALRLSGIDESLQGIDGHHVIVRVRVVESPQNAIELHSQAVRNCRRDVEVQDL